MKPLNPLAYMGVSLAIVSMACRPVIAIGWTELAIILVIIFVLFTPFLLRLFRFFTRDQTPPEKHSDKPDP